MPHPHPDFNPPSPSPKLTSRRTTLTGLFFVALTPYVEPTELEVDRALEILGMSRGACVCAYCGDKKSEWDHFRAVVQKGQPTGYITEIANLVPACGKCNQSRGNKPWQLWMLGKAPQSPTKRGITGLKQKMDRLAAYEADGEPIKLDYQTLAGGEAWERHLAHLADVLIILKNAEEHASGLREIARAFVRNRPGKSR